ncbi:MAG TPA: hypothetical protein VH482_17225 [Thermomicrobiales bacterium]|jgi:hypothetical protein
MAFSARHTLSRGIGLPSLSIPRPGRRTFSLSLGIAVLFVLVDAAAHPRAIGDLWTIDAIERFVGSQGVIVAGTAAVVAVLVDAGRRCLSRPG